MMPTATSLLPSQDAVAIRDMSARWLAAVDSRNVDRVVGFYAVDGAFLAPNFSLAVGRDAVRMVWSRLLGAPGLSLAWTPLSVELSNGCDMAYEIGSYHLEMDALGGRVADDGKYLVVWKRRGDVWSVAADMFNSSLPQPTQSSA
jgi:ketosteroid isomerase-like protein